MVLAKSENNIAQYVARFCADRAGRPNDLSVAAWSSVQNPNRFKVLNSTSDTNPRARVLKDFFDSNLNWIGGQVEIEQYMLQSYEEVDILAQVVLNKVSGLYGIANEVLHEEKPGMDSHGVDHIQANLRLLGHFRTLASDHSELQFTTQEYAVAVLTTVLHDVAQGLIGRKDHGEVAAILTKMILVVAEGTGLAFDLVEQVSENVKKHTTKTWAHKDTFPKPELAAARAMAVLVDEFHVGQDRLTIEGKQLYDAGNSNALLADNFSDEWLFINKHINGMQFSWDDEHQQLKITLQSILEDKTAVKEYQERAFSCESRTLASNEAVTEMHRVLYSAINKTILNNEKINLFKNCCTKIFGRQHGGFTFEVLDVNHQQVYYYNSSCSFKTMGQGGVVATV